MVTLTGLFLNFFAGALNGATGTWLCVFASSDLVYLLGFGEKGREWRKSIV